MNWHQPKNRHTEFLQIVEPGRYAVEVSLLRKCARIDFVDDAVAHPIARRSRLLFRNIAPRLLTADSLRTGRKDQH